MGREAARIDAPGQPTMTLMDKSGAPSGVGYVNIFLTTISVLDIPQEAKYHDSQWHFLRMHLVWR